jgi:PHD/YefM family antitoxin component YafN of YafNO toxin-antitoxin module
MGVPMMTTAVPATEFCRNFATYQRQVQREAIEVQSHGKTTGYFISPEEFERVQRILAESRKAYHPAELPEHLRKAVKRARMARDHAKLDRQLND